MMVEFFNLTNKIGRENGEISQKGELNNKGEGGKDKLGVWG